MRARHKKWAAPFLEEHGEFALNEINQNDPFFLSNPLCLEIGAGKGDFIISMASRFPGSYLALEREISVLGTAGKKLLQSGLTNVRLLGADFDDAYEQLKPLRFDRVYLNFSDPWPKKKHWKRRLTTKERLLKMASLLKEGGHLVIKTDNDSLYEFTLEQLGLAELKTLEFTDDYAFDETQDAMSEYERNFRSQGMKIHRIVASK